MTDEKIKVKSENGQLIEVDMTAHATVYRLLEGRGLPVEHFGEPLRLGPDVPVVRAATTALPGPRTEEMPRAA